MAKSEPTGVGNGLAALLGQPQVAPAKTAEVIAHVSPQPLPEVPSVKVESTQERQVRQAAERDAALEVLRTLPPEGPSQVDIDQVQTEIESAERDLQALQLVHADILNKIKVSTQKVLELQRFKKNLDTRTDAQINQEYLERQKQERFDRHAAMVAKQEALQRMGLMSEDEVQALVGTSKSPVDRSIARANRQAHQARIRGQV